MAESIRMNDVGEVKNPKAENYKEIKPESGMTSGESRFFWDNVFLERKEDDVNDNSPETQETEAEQNPHREVRDGETYYYDDNGKLYRVGKELAPNSEYELNGYKYKTDEKGRIFSAEGTLHLKNRAGRLPIRDSIEDIGKGDQQEGDERGHLIGDQFDGANGLENMISQDAEINQNDFKNFENELADAVREGKEVKVKIEPVYEGDSRRPVAIVVTYSTDGKESVRVFPNRKEES